MKTKEFIFKLMEEVVKNPKILEMEICADTESLLSDEFSYQEIVSFGLADLTRWNDEIVDNKEVFYISGC